jgi:hypothetical protein
VRWVRRHVATRHWPTGLKRGLLGADSCGVRKRCVHQRIARAVADAVEDEDFEAAEGWLRLLWAACERQVCPEFPSVPGVPVTRCTRGSWRFGVTMTDPSPAVGQYFR